MNRAACAALLAAALALAAGGCAGKQQLVNSETQGPSLPATQPAVDAPSLPPFPSGREASGITETVILGKDAEQRSAGVTELGSALELPAGSQPNWALYRFNAGAQPPDSVAVQLEPGQTDGAFIALADYALGKWEMHGPYTAAKTLALDDAKYVSPAGNVWVAVVAPAGTQALVNALSVREVTGANQPPVAALTADVTTGPAPLTVNFDASGSSDPDGSIIEYAWDWDGDGIYDGFTESPTVSHAYAVEGSWDAKVRVTDDRFGRSSTFLTISTSNLSPVAVLRSDATEGGPPLEIVFDASQSQDPDGTIVQYAWDWETDSVIDSTSGVSSSTHVFSTPGNHTVTVTVTDNAGKQDTDSRGITVRGWAMDPQVLDPEAIPDEDCATALVGNFDPAIAYYADQELRFVRAEDISQRRWGAPQTLAPALYGSNVNISMVVVNGKLAIAFLFTDSRVFYIRALDEEATAWSAPVEVGVRHWFDMQVVNGRPAVVGVTYPDLTLGFVQASDADGDSWPTPVHIAANPTDITPSMCIVEGRPAVGFFRKYDPALVGDAYFVRALDADGLAWGSPTLVENTGYSGYNPTLKVVNGKPAMVYLYNYGVKYVSAQDVLGDAWSQPQILDFLGDYGEDTSLAIVNGLPVVSYAQGADGENGPLKIVFAKDADGSNWFNPITVSGSGTHPSLLAVTSSFPILAFCDSQGLRWGHEY